MSEGDGGGEATLARTSGTVKWFDAKLGYGYVSDGADGKEYFAHFSAIRMPGYRQLTKGQAVTFVRATGDKGPRAMEIRPVDGPAAG